MPSVPFAISSQSSKKLKSSEFDAKLLAGVEDKENQVSGVDMPTVDYENVSPTRPLTQEDCFPHTPAVRIPIEDLIANTEDAFNCAFPSATPKDHVSWQIRPDSSDASAAARGTQRSRKRAHSSSPASSQLGASEHFSASKEPLNLDLLNKSLRTPNNDPTQDLWNRYSAVNAAKPDQTEPTLPSYAHLLPSSPQTPSTAGKDGGLRRTHSCGVEWPTSIPKRRKIETNDSHGRTKDLFAASRKEILGRELSNNTRVGLLLDKIQRSLTRKPITEEGPSSSSPLPDRRSQNLVSPTRPQSRARLETAVIPNAGVSIHRLSPQKIAVQPPTISFSEFSDDGLDLEAFESVELAVTQQAERQETTHTPVIDATTTGLVASDNHVPAATQATLASQTSSCLGQQSPVRALPATSQTYDHDTKAPADDEFDDEFDDDEDLMNGIIDLTEKYESQADRNTINEPVALDPSSCQQKAPQNSIGRLESLDEFDDAFDDDDELWDNIAKATPTNGTLDVAGTNNVRLE